ELHVIVHHLPRQLVARHHHFRADETARALPDGGERFRQKLVEDVDDLPAKRALGAAPAIAAAQLLVDAVAFDGVARVSFFLFELGDLGLEGVGALPDDAAEFFRLRAQLGLGHGLQARVVLVDLVNDRLDLLPFALVACAEDCVDDSLEHALLYRYSRSAAMSEATASGTNPRIDFPDFTPSRISLHTPSLP